MKIPAGHIVFLTPGFAESEADSTTIPALQDYVKSISEANIYSKITLISFHFPFKKQPFHWHGVEVIPLNGQNSKFRKLSIWFKVWKTLKKINKANNITLIHSFWIGESSFIGQLFAKKLGIKHIITAMGQDVFKNKYARFLNPKLSQIVTLSKPHHDLLQQNHHIDSILIPWSIETKNFPDLTQNTIDILGVGSLTKIKNYAVFIRVIKMVSTQFPSLKVVMIGEGDQFENLKRQIIESGLTSTITITGKLERDEVYRKMSQSKILLHTSQYESFGYVFAEALYSGMSIVSYPVGISTNIAQWKTANSETEMAEAVITFLKDNSPKTRVALTTKQEMLNAYSELYHE